MLTGLACSFRSAAGDGAIVNQWNAGSSRIAFGRGKTGFVLINNEDSEWSISITVSVPDGTCELSLFVGGWHKTD